MIDPISIGLILAGIAAGVAVLAFWSEIRDFFKRAWNALPIEITQNLQGVVAVAKMIDGKITTALKYYSYNLETQSWNESIASKVVTTDEIPDHIKQRLQLGHEVDYTNDLAKELKLEL